ncbi:MULTISPECIES: RsiV family protein [unclassified Enterococcus]|uniref:RsiV family protein n=1 Tax=unclassified Enterococcus TaxID=2608891 RepID=UPI0013ED017B|nr:MULTISPECIES: RsiV family protein [unclassified Enterococcus]
MYSSKENLKILKQAYKQQELPKGAREEILQRYSIEEQSLKRALRKKKQLHGVVLSFVIAMMALSSIFFSDQARSFAEDLPLIGSVIELVLGRQFTDKNQKIDIRVPAITQGSKEDPMISGLNQKYFQEAKADYEQAKKEYGDVQAEHFQVKGDYQKVLDDERFLVIERDLTQTAADSHTEKKYDTIDKKNGVQLSLPLLFKDDTYISALTKEVEKQMAEQVRQDPSKYYWTQQDFDEGTIEKPALVTPKRDFYLNKEHQLVLVFSPYEIAPGYMGNPEFVIPKSVTRPLLVSPDYLDH